MSYVLKSEDTDVHQERLRYKLSNYWVDVLTILNSFPFLIMLYETS